MPGPMDHSPANVLQRLLVGLSLGVLPSAGSGSLTWPIYCSLEPDEPDNCITVEDQQGRLQGRVQISGEFQGQEGWSIRVRSALYPIGYEKANDIVVSIDQVLRQTVTIGADIYLVQSLTRTTDVIPLRRNVPESSRSLFTINGLISVRKTS